MRQTRFSKQRQLIFDSLVQTREHPSAEMIYQTLKEAHPALSLGTVYRNLNLLVDEGRAVRIPCAVNRYDGATHEHPHFYCTACEALYDLELDVGEGFTQAAKEQGFFVERLDLIFRGRCPRCKLQKSEE